MWVKFIDSCCYIITANENVNLLLRRSLSRLTDNIYYLVLNSGLRIVCYPRWGWLCSCLVTQSCQILRDPVDCSPPGSSVHGTLQSRMDDRHLQDDNSNHNNKRLYIWLDCDVSCLHSPLPKKPVAIYWEEHCPHHCVLPKLIFKLFPRTMDIKMSFSHKFSRSYIGSSFVEKYHKFNFMHIDFQVPLRHWRGTVC